MISSMESRESVAQNFLAVDVMILRTCDIDKKNVPEKGCERPIAIGHEPEPASC